MTWHLSHRADVRCLPLADRHYSRQKPGTPQFVPPGRCLVLWQPSAYWVTSWPFGEYVRHAWPGAWVCSAFRSELGAAAVASRLILEAVSATRWAYPETPDRGMVTFVDPRKVKPVMRRGKPIYGYCFFMAGFEHVGFTKAGLWAWQLRPEKMPEALAPIGAPPLVFSLFGESA